MKHALVTGGAGFIGSHLVDSLMRDDWAVTVLDNFDAFYDPAIKESHIRQHVGASGFRLLRGDVRDAALLRPDLHDRYDVIVHLAALAGVRRSIADPVGYQEVNVTGTQRVLELARASGVRQFVFASSSSVYGINPTLPWREDAAVLMPISPYASTKVSAELLGHVYSHLYGIRFVALRLFTVYGPRQRPDLAIHSFARNMVAGRPITTYGDGLSRRDYTYVDDIVGGIRAAMEYDRTPYEVINLGNSHPIALHEMIAALERALGVRAIVQQGSAIPGDVPQTWASTVKARELLGYEPRIAFEDGLARFAEWMRHHADARL